MHSGTGDFIRLSKADIREVLDMHPSVDLLASIFKVTRDEQV
jgi:hypothetical protein